MLISLSALCLQAQAGEPYVAKKGALRFSYESLTLPVDEPMGLVGMSFLIDLSPQWYGGLSAYGAINGRRGGFFTGGFSAGWSLPITTDWAVDAGLFVGGGGGGAAPQGGGLMLRPYLGLDYQWLDWRWGVQWSQVRFPNGAIDSKQWSLSMERPLQFLLASRWLEKERAFTQRAMSTRFNQRHLAMRLWSYQPLANTRNTRGRLTTAPMHLLGMSMDFQQGTHQKRLQSYISLQTAGALAGNADGYAEVLWAYGWRFPLTEFIDWHWALALGAGGGGSVATGGGLLGRATIAMEYQFADVLEAGLTLGHVIAPQGNFSAKVVGLHLAYRYGVPTVFDQAAQSLTQPQYWRVRGAYQAYRPYGGSRRKGQVVDDILRVDLVGSKIDLMLLDHVYVTGQALGAYDGGAGGYAVGQWGVGWRQPLSTGWVINSELLLGVGGGGGLDVGGGELVQIMVGIERELGDYFSVILSAGQLQAVNGLLKSRVVDLALAWRFSTPVIK